jgi:large repetitive protein
MKMPALFVLVFTSITALLQLQSCKKDAGNPDPDINIENGVWETITTTNLPEARHECSFVNVGNKGYLVGGRGNLPTEEYDFATKTWTKKANPDIELNHFQAVNIKNEIWMAGGFTGGFPGETPVAQIRIFNPANNAWRNGPEIPAARRRGSAGAVYHNGKLYLVCGITNGHLNGHVAWFDEYDPDTRQWKTLPDAPRVRDHFNAVVVGNKLYLAGGRKTSEATGQLFDLTIPEVDVYDFNTQQWSTLPAAKNIPTQRAGTMAVGFEGYVMIIGGESVSQDNAHAEVQAYDTIGEKWVVLQPLKRGRHGTGAFLYNNQIYIAAGSGSRGGSPELDNVERFSIP